MAEMREHGIKRAWLEVQAIWYQGATRQDHVVRRLYFSKYDGPYAQITDAGKLATIASSGLQQILDNVAIEQVKGRRLLIGIDSGKLPSKPSLVDARQELFDNPWFEGSGTPFFLVSEKPSQELANASGIGDVLTVTKILQTKRVPQRELNEALFAAVRAEYDNTAVINALAKSGANVNARRPDGATPLMVAIYRPSILRLLLNEGAHVNDLDKNGHTALQLALGAHETLSAETLKQAGGKK